MRRTSSHTRNSRRRTRKHRQHQTQAGTQTDASTHKPYGTSPSSPQQDASALPPNPPPSQSGPNPSRPHHNNASDHLDAQLGRPKKKKLASEALLRMLSEKKALRQRRLSIVNWSTILLAVLASVAVFVIAANNNTVMGWLGQSSSSNSGKGWVTTIPSAFQMPAPPNMVVLAMGVDVNPDARTEEDVFKSVRTDTMMLGRLRVDRNNTIGASAVSIPRDSKVILSENGWVGKINGAFTYGGPERSVKTVERLTGIPVDYYIVVNLYGIADIVDSLGGVDVYVDSPMKYDDYSGKLHIDFQPGMHHLNGQETLAYIRFRHDGLGDIGRIRRQQVFISALIQKLKDPWTLARLPGVLDAARKHIQTDMPWDILLRAAWSAKHLNPQDIRVATLPGQSVMEDASYWSIRPEQARTLLNQMILDAPSSGKTDVSDVGPVNVGLLYTEAWEEHLEELETILEKAQFSVTCRRQQRKLRSQWVQHEHLPHLGEQISALNDKKLKRLQQVVAPIGGTYETNFCSGSESLTLILGDDMLSAAQGHGNEADASPSNNHRLVRRRSATPRSLS